MIEFEVTVEDEDFRRRMERLPESVSKWVQQGLQQTAQMVQARARQLAPVKTGRLMQSIYVQMVDEYNFKVGCYVPYALYQEFGTRYIQPRYFFDTSPSRSHITVFGCYRFKLAIRVK